MLTKNIVNIMHQRNLLQSIGLDAKTESVYRALLRLADAPAFRISKESGVKRTSVYYILEALAEMGLASVYVSRGVKRYVAENPAKLKTFFEQKMILAERILPELQKEIARKSGKATIRIFEGQEALKSISEEALESKEKIILSIGSSKRLTAFLGGKYGYGERRRKRGIFARSLRFADDASEIRREKLHDVRFLPPDFDFPGFVIIYGTTVGIILFEGSGIGFVVSSDAFSRMAKSVFNALWKTASAP